MKKSEPWGTPLLTTQQKGHLLMSKLKIDWQIWLNQWRQLKGWAVQMKLNSQQHFYIRIYKKKRLDKDSPRGQSTPVH